MSAVRNLIALLILSSLVCLTVALAAPAVPKVERVKPLESVRLDSLPGVFFTEDLEKITRLSERFQDVSTNNGHFDISTRDPLSGKHSIQQEYLPLTEYGAGEDPGSAGWAMRFFGDSPMFTSSIPDDQKKPCTTLVARWYHKYEEGFQPRDGYWPNKNARMRCYGYGDYNSIYAVYFWTDGLDGHLSMEASTKAPGAHRDWVPNHYTDFFYSEAQNVGRWVHYEMRLSLGEGRNSDRLQAWADGLLICDVAGHDIASGYREQTINAMMWDCYWNGGSPRRQSRFYDDLVMSTEPVGPLRTGPNPVIVKSGFTGDAMDAVQAGWEVEVAEGRQLPMRAIQTIDGVVTRYDNPKLDCTVVWRGAVEGAANQVTVDTLSGAFSGPRAGQNGLAPNTLHFVRVRQRDSSGAWSDWSGWHSGFATVWAEGTAPQDRSLPAGYMRETSAAIIDPDSTAPSIQGAAGPASSADTHGPYTVNAQVSDEHLMDVYLYYRAATDTIYQRVTMTAGADSRYSGGIPGFPAGTQVFYYMRVRDLKWNTTYWPADYASAPASFNVLNGDVNGDGKVGLLDILSLLLKSLTEPYNAALDFNADGHCSAADAVALARGLL
ncbi:dockerin type I domain-containing protein [bacterium]|nr:dockerin type I domain-containing protein [bacterium]